MLLRSGSVVNVLQAKNTEGKLATFKRPYFHGVKGKIACPISQMDDYVKHIFREHNRILGAEGQRTIVVAKENNTDKWKMVRGIWDGSSQVRKKQ